MKSNAKTVEEYLLEIPSDRQEAIATVRSLILRNLPEGFVEVMNWGMITYEIPLEIYPDTYNKKPLMYVALASQKNHMAIYLCGLYCFAEVKEKFLLGYEKSGKKLNMGASCIRFKKLDDLCLEAIGEAIASVSLKSFVENAKSCRKKSN